MKTMFFSLAFVLIADAAELQTGNGLSLQADHAGLFALGPMLYVGLLIGVAALCRKALMLENAKWEKNHKKEPPPKRTLEDDIRQLCQADPTFETNIFLRRSSHAYRLFQRAETNQDLSPIRHLVSDAVYERSLLQMEELKRRGIHKIVEDLIVQEKEIVQVDLDEHFQTITVRFESVARRYAEDTKGNLLPGHKFPQCIDEYWTLVRRTGATTRESGGLVEGKCPNCGTALQLNETGVCSTCNAKVWSGRYDWILTEITHQSAWRVHWHHDVPGVPILSQSDPEFCLQQLHDRASAIFWRRITAWQTGDVTLLRNVATEDYCQEFAQELVPDPDGSRRIPAAVTVGAVEAAGILCQEPFDQALIRIKWCCSVERAHENGKHRPDIPMYFRIAFFLLTRKHGAQGSLDDGLSSSHCRACGAPALGDNPAVCSHCGTPFMDKDHDWLLSDVYREGEQPVKDLFQQFARLPNEPRHSKPSHTPSSALELMAWVVQVMLADDQATEEEKALLPTIAAAHGVSEQDLEALMRAARARQLELKVPENAKTARGWLATMTEMAMVDGETSATEKQVMYAVGKRVGLGRKKVNRIINNTKKRLRGEKACRHKAR